MTESVLTTEIAEALSLGDVHLQIIRRYADGRSRFTARFAATADALAASEQYDLCELHELEAAVSAAVALLRFLEHQTTVVDLARSFADLRAEHRLTEGPR